MTAGWLLFTLVALVALKEQSCTEISDEYGEPSRNIEDPGVVYQKLKWKFLQLGEQDLCKLDIVFVMDKSRNVGRRAFGIEKRIVNDFLEYFPVFPAKTRVAVVSYSTKLKVEFDFRKNSNKECTQRDIENIRYTGGSTATGDTLQWIHSRLIFNSEEGARSDAKKIIFLLTSGKSNGGVRPSFPADRLRRRGVTIYVLGVTEKIPRSELVSIASAGPSHVFHLGSPVALNYVIRLLRRDISQNCHSGQVVFDQCGRRCKCERGRLVECCRQRKEFTDMSFNERARYINTVKTASTNPTYKARYERFLTSHRTYFFSNIHQVDFFLPWHRWFILQYENLLREIDCMVTVPYWDWSQVAGSPFSSDMWNPGQHGFGGNGSGDPSCVRTGPFRAGVWSVIESAGGGCLTRSFNGTAPDALAVRNLILENLAAEFVNFEFLLRVQFHDVVHCIIDGIMCSINSASAPEFFLHHGFVDKVWWDWQKQSNAHKYTPFFMSQTDAMPATTFLSRDFLDLRNQPGCTCVDYVPTNTALYRTIAGLSKAQIQRIPRLAMPLVGDKITNLFGYTPEDIRRLNRLKEDISPRTTLVKSELHGRDSVYGFRITDVREAEKSVQ